MFHNKTILLKIAVKIRWFVDETLCHISSVRVSHIVGNSTIIGQQLDSSFISTFHGKYNGTASMQTVEKKMDNTYHEDSHGVEPAFLMCSAGL